MSIDYKKTSTFKSLDKERQEVIIKVETAKRLNPLKAEVIKDFKGIYLWSTISGILFYPGKSFPKNLKAATRIKQHLTGDLTVSSAARYFHEKGNFLDLDQSLLEYREEDDELIHINNAYRRDQMLSTMRVALIDVPEKFSDGTQVEDFIHSYYKDIENKINDAVTNYTGVELINKPGSDRYRKDPLRRWYELVSKLLVTEFRYSVKSVQTKHVSLRLKVPFGSSKDYFNLTGRNFTSSKFRFYLNKSQYTNSSIEKFISFLASEGIDFNTNSKTISINFQFTPSDIKGSFLRAEKLLKEMLEV